MELNYVEQNEVIVWGEHNEILLFKYHYCCSSPFCAYAAHYSAQRELSCEMERDIKQSFITL